MVAEEIDEGIRQQIEECMLFKEEHQEEWNRIARQKAAENRVPLTEEEKQLRKLDKARKQMKACQDLHFMDPQMFIIPYPATDFWVPIDWGNQAQFMYPHPPPPPPPGAPFPLPQPYAPFFPDIPLSGLYDQEQMQRV